MLLHGEEKPFFRETCKDALCNTMTVTRSRILTAFLVLVAFLGNRGAAQEPEERKPQKPDSMGVATGNPHAPVKDVGKWFHVCRAEGQRARSARHAAS